MNRWKNSKQMMMIDLSISNRSILKERIRRSFEKASTSYNVNQCD